MSSTKLLEVIITSLDEAKEAEQGGANRLELVSDLASEGLTPAINVVEDVLRSVSIPVRVMLRENEGFAIENADELEQLRKRAAELAALPVNGIVLGFVKDGRIDYAVMNQLLACTGSKPVTFHRAIEAVSDQQAAVREIGMLPQIDRILTSGAAYSWAGRRRTLETLQELALGRVIVAGGGITEDGLEFLAASPILREFHVGRAARDAANRVQSSLIYRLRSLLG